MMKILFTILCALALPVIVYAFPVSLDGDFITQELKPLSAFSGADWIFGSSSSTAALWFDVSASSTNSTSRR